MEENKENKSNDELSVPAEEMFGPTPDNLIPPEPEIIDPSIYNYPRNLTTPIPEEPKPLIISKKCSRCRHEKNREEFRKCAKNKDGLSAYCKSCHDAISKNHYINNKQKRITQITKWQQTHVNRLKRYQKNFRKKHSN